MDILKLFRKKSKNLIKIKEKFTTYSLQPKGLQKSKEYLKKLCEESPAHCINYKRAFFSTFKDLEVQEAILVGEEVILKEPDPAFMRVLAARHKRIGNIQRAKDLLLSISNRDYYINAISLKSITSVLDNCKDDKERENKIREMLTDFPNEKVKIYEFVFSILKDSSIKIATKYGKLYFKENPKNFKFANILLKRLEQINDVEGTEEIQINKQRYNLLKKLKQGQLFTSGNLNTTKYKNELKVVANKLGNIHIEEYISHLLENFPKEHIIIHKIAFSILKSNHTELAVQYGKAYLTTSPHDSKFGRFLKNSIEKSQTDKEKALILSNEKNDLKKLKQSSFCTGKKLNEKAYKVAMVSFGSSFPEHLLKDFIDFLIHKFPNQTLKIHEISFSTLKDTHTALAVDHGSKYIDINPENYKFAKVVIKRMERLGLRVEMLETAKKVLQHHDDPDLKYLLFHDKLKTDIAECESLYLDNNIEVLNNKLIDMEHTNSNKASLYREFFKFYAKKEYALAESYALKSLELRYNEYLIKELYDLHITYGSITKAVSVLPENSKLPTLAIKKKNGSSLLDLYHKGFDLPVKTVPNYIPIDKKVFYLLHNRLPYNSGGYATRSHGLLTGVSQYGWTMNGVSRLGYPWDKMPDKESLPMDTIDDINYHRLLNEDIGLGKLPLKTYLEEYANALLEIAKKEKPAIIHAASNYMNGIVGNYVAKCLGIKSVYEVRGLWEITRISRQPDWKDTEYYNLMVKMETEAAKGADIVFTLTEALKEEMIDRGVSAHKIHLLPNGVVSDRFKPLDKNTTLAKNLDLENKIVIGFIGSFVQYEGLNYLVDAVKLLVDRGIVNIGVLMVGDGAVWEETKEHVERIGLSDYFVFTGRVPHEDVEQYYSLVDIAPFPRKGLPVCEMVSPLKPFEAMAMEKAVLSSNVSALAEIVKEGHNGLLFEKDNVQDFSDKLELLIDDEKLRKTLGSQAREWVIKERDWNVISKRLHTAYDSFYKDC